FVFPWLWKNACGLRPARGLPPPPCALRRMVPLPRSREGGRRSGRGRYKGTMDHFGARELLACYASGVFPMADAREDQRVFLIDPQQRGVLPLERFHVPRRLARTVRQAPFEIRVDTAFAEVVALCAE